MTPRSALRAPHGLARSLAVLLLVQPACATRWTPRPDLPTTVQSVVHVRSTPAAEVLVGGRRLGRTPLEVPVSYRRLDNRFVRQVTLWQSDPGLAIAICVLSLGLYLPFSLIPVVDQDRVEIGERFDGDVVTIALEAGDLARWEQRVELRGVPEYTIDVDLRNVTSPGR